MNKIEKLLLKLSKREVAIVKDLLSKINAGNYKNLDIKKLKGNKNLFRVRKGDIRIIFSAESGIRILSVSRRNDTTYNF